MDVCAPEIRPLSARPMPSFCHWYCTAPAPSTSTENVAVLPRHSSCPAGCARNVGAGLTATTAPREVTEPQSPVTTQVYVPLSAVSAGVISSADAAEPEMVPVSSSGTPSLCQR